jgi:hypothetical protein
MNYIKNFVFIFSGVVCGFDFIFSFSGFRRKINRNRHAHFVCSARRPSAVSAVSGRKWEKSATRSRDAAERAFGKFTTPGESDKIVNGSNSRI